MPLRPLVFSPGTVPLLVSMPHVGTDVPDWLAGRLTGAGRGVPDTDWLVDRLYDFLGDLGASVLAATHSRYVVDLNRPETDESLYPGQTTTGLFPDTTFTGATVWTDPPNAAERDRIRAEIWRPYHARIRMELDRLVAAHGFACLWEAHSIAPILPRLFDGRLPDLNLGSFDGAACPASVAMPVLDQASAVPELTTVLDGRFKGGFITRSFGQPDRGIFALQMEIAQSAYLVDGSYPDATGHAAEPPPRIDFAKAELLRPMLRSMMQQFLSAAADFQESR